MTSLIPLETLFGNPERALAQLSPDATRVAWVAPVDGVLNLWVAPLTTDGHGIDYDAATVVTKDRDRGIRRYMWAHDGRHILFLLDTGGDENWRLFDVDLVTGLERLLTPFDDVAVQLLWGDQQHPNDILVGINKDNPELHDLYHLDLTTGALTKRADNPGIVEWLIDSDMTVRGGVRPLANGGFEILVGDVATQDWRVLLEVGHEDSLTTTPLSISADGTSLLAISSLGADTAGLVRIDLASGAVTDIVRDDEADITGVLLHPQTLEPQIVTVLKGRSVYRVVDPSVADDFDRVRALHHGDPSISSNDDDTVWMVSFTSDNGAVPYYVFDRRTKESQFLFFHQPALNDCPLASMETFELTARDGLPLRGYVTFPVGVERRNLPAVLNVHGGPWARDTWGFDPEAQFLANRGYVCLQVNFRGSTGYGKSFLNAGDKEWGAKMHDDLLDTVDYAVRQGWVDADRVAIMGGSYGGYAALVGAAFTPDAFRCAVDLVGPSNLKTLIESIPPYWAPIIEQFNQRVGNLATEPEFLWERSPLSKATDIRVPLLIAQGANDPRVKQAEAEQIVAALTEAGIAHEYLLFPDEGHGFAKPENRFTYYRAVESFFAQYL